MVRIVGIIFTYYIQKTVLKLHHLFLRHHMTGLSTSYITVQFRCSLGHSFVAITSAMSTKDVDKKFNEIPLVAIIKYPWNAKRGLLWYFIVLECDIIQIKGYLIALLKIYLSGLSTITIHLNSDNLYIVITLAAN